jgi:uncharacterized protein YukE
MPGHLRVDPAVIANLSVRLGDAGETVNKAVKTFVDGSDALGQPWGRNDEVARTFVHDYVNNKDVVVEGTQKLGEFLVDASHKIAQAGNELSSTDQVN